MKAIVIKRTVPHLRDKNVDGSPVGVFPTSKCDIQIFNSTPVIIPALPVEVDDKTMTAPAPVLDLARPSWWRRVLGAFASFFKRKGK